MGHSICKVGQRVEMFNDIDLMVALRVMEERVRADPHRYAPLLRHADLWAGAVEMNAPGVVDPRLEEVAQDPDATATFERLLVDLEQSLPVNESFPVQTLRTRWPIPRVSFRGPYRAQHLHLALEQLRRLFSPPKPRPSILRYLAEIRARPEMYVGDPESPGSSPLQRLTLLVWGYEGALRLHGLEEESQGFLREFAAFVRTTTGWSTSGPGVVYAIESNTESRDDAWRRFWQLLEQYSVANGW